MGRFAEDKLTCLQPLVSLFPETQALRNEQRTSCLFSSQIDLKKKKGKGKKTIHKKEASFLCLCVTGGTQQENASLQFLTVPLGLRGHWLVISVLDTNSRITQKCKGTPTSAPVSRCFEGTHLRTFSLTLRGAASQALTASSRVIPRVHLPQM